MYSRQILKTLLIPAATIVVAEKDTAQDPSKSVNVCRPSELPIYTPEPPPVKEISEKGASPSYIEDTITTVRTTLTHIYREAQAYQRVGMEYAEQGRDNAEWLFQYLRQEDNTTPKAGAIAIGGLTGLIFGLRGRFLKRTLYATTGALGMAAICYPKEASYYSQIAITETRKYATIAYNFIYGVKKDDPPLELPSLPKIPSSFSDAWDSVAKSASSLVSVTESEEVKQVIAGPTSTTTVVDVDPRDIVAKVHESTSQSCHCPIGACLGHQDENKPPATTS